MKTTSDVRSFAKLLGKSIDSLEVKSFIDEYGASLNPNYSEGRGELSCHAHGFDVLLSNREASANPAEALKAPSLRVALLRFFSPKYCAGKGISPYSGRLVGNLMFPLTRERIHAELGTPARHSASVRHFDEYDYSDSSVRFVYPKNGTDVAFLELMILPDSRPIYGIGKPLSADERLTQLSGDRRKHWEFRLRAYEATFGPVEQVIPGGETGIDLMVIRESDDYLTLLTNGMSDSRMCSPSGSAEPCRIELEMYVKEVNREAVNWLFRAATFPFVDKTYLGHGDTINWMCPIVPNSSLAADLVIYSILSKHRTLSFTIDGDTVQMFWCVPISVAELAFKKEYGIDALLRLFDSKAHPLVLNVYRRSYV